MREKIILSIALIVSLSAIAPALKGPPQEIRQAQSLLQSKDYDGAIKILEEFTKSAPKNPFGSMMPDRAYHLKGDIDKALPAHIKAAEFPQNTPVVTYNVACAYALKDNKEEALKWLGRVRQTGNFDMSRAAADPDLKSLHGDPRFENLMPKPEDFADPFVEKTKIIHEWVGEAANAQFGWIAGNIGDFDKDGINDVTTSAPTLPVDGKPAGRVYAYSGKSGKLLWTQTGQPGDNLGLGIEAGGDGFGIGPADAGDVNRNGYDDLIIGAWQHKSAASSGGKIYLYSGKDGSLSQTHTCRIPGNTLGFDATGMGDVDGDGTIDFLLTSAWSSIKGFRSGRMFIISGKADK